MKLPFPVFALCVVVLSAADEAGKIMRPSDKAAFPAGPVDIVATAPSGILALDGVKVTAEQPFPNVLHAKITPTPGVHTLTLTWEGGSKQVQFYAGNEVPAGFITFRAHPPAGETKCTQCHELSRRGRFVFKGGCFDCHATNTFAKVHTHTPDVLSECGLCHNAHGSIVKSHLTHTKDIACKQCHN